MKNIDKIKNMNIDELATISAIPFTYMNGYRVDTIYRGAFSGCDYDFKEDAVEGELKWLNSEETMLSSCCVCGWMRG